MTCAMNMSNIKKATARRCYLIRVRFPRSQFTQ